MKIINKKLLIPFFIISLLFLMWGLANNMNDTLLAAFKRILSISDLQSSLVQFSFYGAYFCFAIPAALFIQKFSYKAGILFGIALYAAGTILFYPAGQLLSYSFFLFAIYVMAGGCAILETAANPYILSMGEDKTATRRLNIAQAFNPIGALGGILLSRHFILSSLNEADAAERAQMDKEVLKDIQIQEFNSISETYLIIGGILILLFIVILVLKMPQDKDNDNYKFTKTFIGLLKNKEYINGVTAQFFYVGAQTCVWSFTIRYVMYETGCVESEASIVFLWSIILFTVFRFIMTWLMKYVKAARLLLYSAILAFILTLEVIFINAEFTIIALALISACMSLMFPTIYGISLESVLPEERKVGASGLIMAILGGALITPLQGLLSDLVGISFSFFVTAFCFLIIIIYSILSLKNLRAISQ